MNKKKSKEEVKETIKYVVLRVEELMKKPCINHQALKFFMTGFNMGVSQATLALDIGQVNPLLETLKSLEKSINYREEIMTTKGVNNALGIVDNNSRESHE